MPLQNIYKCFGFINSFNVPSNSSMNISNPMVKAWKNIQINGGFPEVINEIPRDNLNGDNMNNNMNKNTNNNLSNNMNNNMNYNNNMNNNMNYNNMNNNINYNNMNNNINYKL